MANVLVLRAGALGDILLLRRAVAALNRAGHSLTLLAPEAPASALLGAGPAEVRRLIPWERSSVAELTADTLRQNSPLAHDLAGFEAALAYTRNREVCANLERLIPRFVPWDPQPPPGSGHASRWFGRGAAPLTNLLDLDLDLDEDPPNHAPTPEEAREAAPWLARLPPGFLALHPGSGSPAKNWPGACFLAAVEALAPRQPWLLVEGPADAATAAPLRSPHSVSARGTRPRLLGAILAGAGLYLGNDSGVTHLAAAWGAPTLALFGPTDPAVWGPVGSLVTTLRSPDGTMAGLGVRAVVATARQRFRVR